MERRAMLTALALLGVSHLPAQLVEGAIQANDSPQTQQQIEKQLRASGARKLDLELQTGGSLDIVGWNEDTVSARLYLGGQDWKECRFEANETPSGIQILSRYIGNRPSYSTSLRFEIKVPRNFDLAVKSKGGEIKISNIEGTIIGETMGGSLNLTELKGDISLTTMGGSISLTNSDVDGEVKTMGGQVLIQNVSGNVKGISMGGNVIYKNVTNRNGNVVSR